MSEPSCPPEAGKPNLPEVLPSRGSHTAPGDKCEQPGPWELALWPHADPPGTTEAVLHPSPSIRARAAVVAAVWFLLLPGTRLTDLWLPSSWPHFWKRARRMNPLKQDPPEWILVSACRSPDPSPQPWLSPSSSSFSSLYTGFLAPQLYLVSALTKSGLEPTTEKSTNPIPRGSSEHNESRIPDKFPVFIIKLYLNVCPPLLGPASSNQYPYMFFKCSFCYQLINLAALLEGTPPGFYAIISFLGHEESLTLIIDLKKMGGARDRARGMTSLSIQQYLMMSVNVLRRQLLRQR